MLDDHSIFQSTLVWFDVRKLLMTKSPMKNDLIHSVAEKFSNAFSPQIFFTVRGCENAHIYFWIGKDLGWILNNTPLGMLFGAFALLWLIVLLHHAIEYKNNEEKYFLVPTFLWLFANYLWMTGNLLYGTDVFRFAASILMLIGLILIVIYFGFLKNWVFFTPNPEVARAYDTNGLICRFSFFNTWRRYELVHVFFWLLKDYAWCTDDKIVWLFGAIPTLLVSGDFIYVGLKNKRMVVDTAHYVAQFIWICSNLTWAAVELFSLNDKAEGYDRLGRHPNGRLVGALILLLAYVPIIALYCVWLPLTLSGHIKNVNEDGTAGGSVQAVSTNDTDGDVEIEITLSTRRPTPVSTVTDSDDVGEVVTSPIAGMRRGGHMKLVDQQPDEV